MPFADGRASELDARRRAVGAADASTTTASSSAQSPCPRCCRAPSACASRRRSPPEGRAAVPRPPHPPNHGRRPRRGSVGAGGQPYTGRSDRGFAVSIAARRRRARGAARPNRCARRSGRSSSGMRSHTGVGLVEPQPVTTATDGPGPIVAVVCEPDRERHARELLGAAATLASEIGGSTVALALDAGDPSRARRVRRRSRAAHRRRARRGRRRARGHRLDRALPAAPWAILTGSTIWGREVASRDRGPAGCRAHGRRDRPRSRRRRPARGVEARVRWAADRRDHGDVTGPDGDGARRRARDPSAAHARHPRSARSRSTPRPRDRDGNAPATTISTCSPTHRRVVGIGRGVKPSDYPPLEPLAERPRRGARPRPER